MPGAVAFGVVVASLFLVVALFGLVVVVVVGASVALVPSPSPGIDVSLNVASFVFVASVSSVVDVSADL